jgi:hypothetical protein
MVRVVLVLVQTAVSAGVAVAPLQPWAAAGGTDVVGRVASTTCARCIATDASDWCWKDRACYTSGPNPFNPCADDQCASGSQLSFCVCRSCTDTTCSAAAPPPPVPKGPAGLCDELKNDVALFHRLH